MDDIYRMQSRAGLPSIFCQTSAKLLQVHDLTGDSEMQSSNKISKRPTLTLPEPAAAVLREEYTKAKAIIEYGSGGSTVVASENKDCTVFSVESDLNWLQMMQNWFNENPPAGVVRLHHADIGPTKEWGNPIDERKWRNFVDYPYSVWQRNDLIEPDVVLIDGRFRVGCFLATIFSITRETTILFDDYLDRPTYKVVEEYTLPESYGGRMAVFRVSPQQVDRSNIYSLIKNFAKII